MEGWISLHRKIQDHWIYEKGRQRTKFEAWIDMLQEVNHSDSKILIKGNLYDVKRGQSINSMKTWAFRWKWDKSKVRRFFELLKNDKMIDYKTDTKTTHLTILNYDSYQDIRTTKKTQTKRKRNANETQTNINNNGIMTNNEEIKIIKYREFVQLTEIENDKLLEKCKGNQDWLNKIYDKLDNQKGSTGKTYKSDYRAILNWVYDAVPEPPKKLTEEEERELFG